jgi:hypothetical protein
MEKAALKNSVPRTLEGATSDSAGPILEPSNVQAPPSAQGVAVDLYGAPIGGLPPRAGAQIGLSNHEGSSPLALALLVGEPGALVSHIDALPPPIPAFSSLEMALPARPSSVERGFGISPSVLTRGGGQELEGAGSGAVGPGLAPATSSLASSSEWSSEERPSAAHKLASFVHSATSNTTSTSSQLPAQGLPGRGGSSSGRGGTLTRGSGKSRGGWIAPSVTGQTQTVAAAPTALSTRGRRHATSRGGRGYAQGPTTVAGASALPINAEAAQAPHLKTRLVTRAHLASLPEVVHSRAGPSQLIATANIAGERRSDCIASRGPGREVPCHRSACNCDTCMQIWSLAPAPLAAPPPHSHAGLL